MKIKTILASDIAVLDSSVYTGGGTDATVPLQKALDEALSCGGVHLIMDGAALISGLKVHSNTTIECLTRDCGFFQLPRSRCALITNADWQPYSYSTRNITLVGGTYNQDCLNQEHDFPIPEDHMYRRIGTPDDFDGRKWTFGLEFYGVENLTVRDLNLRNFRTFGITVCCFRHVLLENIWLDLPDRMQAQNQDGFHFWGPGQFLTIRNVGGRVGDDFMNIGPDEHDGKSDITDVLVDGVFLDDADQAIRMLTNKSGRLDRVTVRNVTGTYRSFGFYLNCWFPGSTYGNFGNIFFENIDLRQTAPNYDYCVPMLFSIGGNIECMTFKNIRHHNPFDARSLFELGLPFYDRNYIFPEDNKPRMKNFIIDGLTIIEDGNSASGAEYIKVFADIDRLMLNGVTVIREGQDKPNGHLLSFAPKGRIKQLIMRDILTNGFDKLIDGEERIDRILSSNVVSER